MQSVMLHKVSTR